MPSSAVNAFKVLVLTAKPYVNSEAALAHLNGAVAQTILPKIFNISKINRFEVFGDPLLSVSTICLHNDERIINLISKTIMIRLEPALHSQSIEVKLHGVGAKSKSSLRSDMHNMKSPIYYI